MDRVLMPPGLFCPSWDDLRCANMADFLNSLIVVAPGTGKAAVLAVVQSVH
jgi:hypothetical protein